MPRGSNGSSCGAAVEARRAPDTLLDVFAAARAAYRRSRGVDAFIESAESFLNFLVSDA